MRLRCQDCGKVISSEVPEDTIVRAALACPECMEKALMNFAKEIKEGFECPMMQTDCEHFKECC